MLAEPSVQIALACVVLSLLVGKSNSNLLLLLSLFLVYFANWKSTTEF